MSRWWLHSDFTVTHLQSPRAICQPSAFSIHGLLCLLLSHTYEFVLRYLGHFCSVYQVLTSSDLWWNNRPVKQKPKVVVVRDVVLGTYICTWVVFKSKFWVFVLVFGRCIVCILVLVLVLDLPSLYSYLYSASIQVQVHDADCHSKLCIIINFVINGLPGRN